MHSIVAMGRKFRHEDSGATAIEYAILTILVTVGVIGAVAYAGNGSQQTFCSVAGGLGSGCGQAVVASTPPASSGPACSVMTFSQTPTIIPGTQIEVMAQNCSTAGASVPTVSNLSLLDMQTGNDGSITFYASGGWVALAEAGSQTTALENECKTGSGPTSLLSGFSGGNSSAIESVPASGFSQGTPSFVASDVTKPGTPRTQLSNGPFNPIVGTPIPAQSSTPATSGQQYVTCAP